MSWAATRERGGRRLLSLMLWITLHLGWFAARPLLLPITAWFFVTSPEARRASREFLGRALDRPVRTADVFRHMFTFAAVILDRVFLLSGRTRGYRIEVRGLELVTGILATGRGCVLLGSHLGSFEVLRAFGRKSPVAINAVMFRANGGHLTRLLERLDPDITENLIEVGDPAAMIRVGEALDRGEIVGFLADRAPRRERTVEVPFLGAAARFPTGPFVVAAATGAPAVLFYGLRVGPRHYVVEFRLLAERIILPRDRRGAALAESVAAYAGELAATCRVHPFNWFNFFPFWAP